MDYVIVPWSKPSQGFVFVKIFILISFVFLSLPVNSRLLDKIAAVIDENIITLSQLKRIQSNLYARKKISNVIYQKDKYTDVEIAKILVERFLIREKLSEIGYVIRDEQVEMQIKAQELEIKKAELALKQQELVLEREQERPVKIGN